MIKTYLVLAIAGTFQAPVSAKTTIINSGSSPIFVCDCDTTVAMEGLEEPHKQAVLKALHSVEPGKSIPLKAGNYHLSFGESLNGSAVLLVETKPAPAVPPTPPADGQSNDANPNA